MREGEAWKLILEEAVNRHCELIVVGPSSDGADLEEALFGQTAERLAHRASQPILIARRPGERPYEHLVAATDFSDGSRHALLTAAALLPEARLTPMLVFGDPHEAIVKRDSEDRIDVVVLGVHGHTGPLEKVLGGPAEMLLKTLPMDVMLVREA